MLLRTLIQVIPGGRPSEPADPSSGLSQSPEEAFQCYVYKLAQVCDNERGGTTVTSFAVLREPDKIFYIFASNQMTAQQMEDVKAFVTSILTKLQEALTLGDFGARLTNTIRRDILRFNKPRLDHYIRHFAAQLPECLSRCASEDPSSDASQGSNLLLDLGYTT